ncbi:MAG: type 1 glutamine amidotransferase [Rhodocyclaceae bacterium]|nr:type 1 glutamine amidotransferase [Rhodocyclaceae bacterium]
MKPVAIFRFAPTEGPAFFADWLTTQGIPWTEVRIDQGEPVPQSAVAFSGIGMMGGPMSVNDPLPWIGPLLELIRDADRSGVPVIGHCLGGQLMSRAFGGEVGVNRSGGEAAKEIGWHSATPTAAPEARDWFGTSAPFDVFQWHGETFSVPPGAARLASSPLCTNQAFSRGPHIGMQFHVEMDEPTIDVWCRSGAGEVAEALAGPRPGGVQSADQVHLLTAERLPRMRTVTDRIYRRWTSGLRRD